MSLENPTWQSAKDSWRPADARNRRQRIDRRTVHDQEWPIAFTGVEGLLRNQAAGTASLDLSIIRTIALKLALRVGDCEVYT